MIVISAQIIWSSVDGQFMSKSDSEVQEIRAIRAISHAVERCDFPDFGRPNSDIEEARDRGPER